jgi:hypothetical protein
MTKTCLEMARAVRAQTDLHDPSELYYAAIADTGRKRPSLESISLYQHAMLEAGYVIPKDSEEPLPVCSICGHKFVEPQS